MSKKDLEIALERLESFKNPDPELEQYQTPANMASILLWKAKMEGCLEGVVYDLGCGAGTLAIGASLLGAEAVGVDIDPEALKIARKNAKKIGVDVKFVRKDVKKIKASADTVVQNPPFGCQEKGKDRPFVKKALEIAPVVYSFHMAETKNFIEKYVNKLGGTLEYSLPLSFPLKKTMPWHEKNKEKIKVILCKFVR